MPAENVRKTLHEGVEAILRIAPGEAEKGVSAFNTFKRGVTHAATGRDASPEELLGDLEPKDAVLAFLMELHEKKKMLRKQTAAVMTNLLDVHQWAQALKSDPNLLPKLPDDLRPILDSAPEPPPAKEEEVPAAAEAVPAPSPVSASESVRDDEIAPPPPPEEEKEQPSIAPTKSELQRVVARAHGAQAPQAGSPERAPAKASSSGAAHAAPMVYAEGSPEAIQKFLEDAKAHMEALNFSAANTDEAATAFETFRKNITKAVRAMGSDVEDDGSTPIDRLEPKGHILEFLTEFHERRRLYRHRIAATLTMLLAYDSWSDAAEEDPSVQALVSQLVGGGDGPPRQTLRHIPGGAPGKNAINLRLAASKAAEQGGVGALLVRVLAGYDLINTDETGFSDPYVRVSLGSSMKRTNVVNDSLNPKWDSSPYVFVVRSLHDETLFEVFDDDFVKSDPMGSLRLRVSEASDKPGAPPIRRPLEGVDSGELEVELLYAAASQDELAKCESRGAAAGRPRTLQPVPDRPGGKEVAPAPGGGGYPAASASTPAFVVGQRMDYHSVSAGRWIPCKITAVHPSGALQIDCKPGYWMTRDEVAKSLRGAAAGLSADPSMATGTAGSSSAARSERGSWPYAVGHQVEYHSTTAGTWLACKVVAVEAATGALQVGIKPGYWFSLKEQEQKIRPKGGTSETARGAPRASATSACESKTGSAAPGWVAWLSVDPRKGELNFYTDEVARKLEDAWSHGAESLDLGESCFNARVEMRPRMIQRTGRGSRDVRRVELQAPTDPCIVYVVKGNDWRAAAGPFAEGAQKQTATPKAGMVVRKSGATGVRGGGGSCCIM